MKINKIQNKPQRCEWCNVNNILLRGKFLKLWKENWENSYSNMLPFRGILITLTGKGLCSFLWLLLPVSGHVEPEPLFCEKVQLSRQSVLLGSRLQMHRYPLLNCYWFAQVFLLPTVFSSSSSLPLVWPGMSWSIHRLYFLPWQVSLVWRRHAAEKIALFSLW